MTRVFPLAPMSGLFMSLTVFLWCLPLLFFAGQPWGLGPILVPTGCFVVLIYASVWLWYRPSRFEVTPEGLTAVFPLRRRTTPLTAVGKAERIDPKELKRRYGQLYRVGAGGLWGGFGLLWRPGTKVEFYSSRMDGWVLIQRQGRPPLLITPERPDELVALLSSRG